MQLEIKRYNLYILKSKNIHENKETNNVCRKNFTNRKKKVAIEIMLIKYLTCFERKYVNRVSYM